MTSDDLTAAIDAVEAFQRAAPGDTKATLARQAAELLSRFPIGTWLTVGGVQYRADLHDGRIELLGRAER